MIRIFPAFWICLILTAFVAAPVAALARGASWEASSSLAYLRGNGLLWISQYGIEHTLGNVPYPKAWNGSLWTLFYEFGAYLIAGVVLWPQLVRRHAAPVLWSAVLLAAIAVPLAHGPLNITTNLYLNFLRLGSFFVAGMALWSVKDRLPASKVAAAICGLIVFGLFFQSSIWFTAVAPIPLAYLLLSLGGMLPTRIGVDNDVSYGIYIYAFPVAQLLALAGAHRLGLIPMMVLTALCTVPLAWGSWLIIERPAMALKNLASRRPQAAPAVLNQGKQS